jgi:hypothetical protein
MSSVTQITPPLQHHSTPPKSQPAPPKPADNDGDNDGSAGARPANPPGVGGRVDKTA